mmetsp:Transcript_96745/g.166788  ORF Transcript_96745/g.166788 Transcript_96745/m.166788 type:complete len:334 (-) Transcript_96745:1074-2075(-)
MCRAGERQVAAQASGGIPEGLSHQDLRPLRTCVSRGRAEIEGADRGREAATAAQCAGYRAGQLFCQRPATRTCELPQGDLRGRFPPLRGDAAPENFQLSQGGARVSHQAGRQQFGRLDAHQQDNHRGRLQASLHPLRLQGDRGSEQSPGSERPPVRGFDGVARGACPWDGTHRTGPGLAGPEVGPDLLDHCGRERADRRGVGPKVQAGGQHHTRRLRKVRGKAGGGRPNAAPPGHICESPGVPAAASTERPRAAPWRARPAPRGGGRRCPSAAPGANCRAGGNRRPMPQAAYGGADGARCPPGQPVAAAGPSGSAAGGVVAKRDNMQFEVSGL